MSCEEIQPQLSAFVDGNLDGQTAGAVEVHLTDCAICRNEQEALAAVHATLTGAFVDERERAGVIADRLLRQRTAPAPEATVSGRARRFLRASIAYLAATVLGFLIAVVLLQPRQNVGRHVNPIQQADAHKPQPTGTSQPRIVPAAYLRHATGPVSYRPPAEDQWVSISREQLSVFTCPSDSAVKTEPGSLCELETSTGCLLRLNESSEIALRSETELELVRGQLWCRASADGGLRVVASEAAPAELAQPVTLHCPTNTACLTLCSPREPLQVAATAGSVELTANGLERRLPSGSLATFTNGEVEVRESAAELFEAVRWMQPLLTLGGHNNPELTERVDALLARIGRAKLSLLYEQDLRNLGEYGALPLLRFVQSEESRQQPSRRIVAMRIIADTAPIWIVPDLIELLEDHEPRVRAHAAAALTRLTGQSQGLRDVDWQGDRPQWSDGLAGWKAWWQQHRFSCSPPPPGVAQIQSSGQ